MESAREKSNNNMYGNTNEGSIDFREEEDLLEPQCYPDATLFKTSLEGLSQDEEDFKKHLTSNKATLRALAPYLQILHKDQKKKMESVKKTPKSEGMVPIKSKEQVITVVPDVTQNPELVSSIVETGETLRNLINARNVSVYLADQAKNEIYYCPKELCVEKQDILKIEEGTTLAAYAAFKRELIVSKNLLSDSRFPLGLSFPYPLAKFGLGVPIKTPNDDLIAVYELNRDGFSIPFEKKDEQMILAVTGWMGAGILQKAIYDNLERQYETTYCLQQLSFHYHCDRVDKESAFSDIVVFARETIDAEHCIFYLIVKMTKDYCVVEEYEQGSEEMKIMVKKYTNKVVKNQDSYLYKVLMEKEIFNVVGNKIHEMESSVKSMLCVPILCTCKEVLGAIRLINKRSAENFNKDDEKTLMTFSSFFSIQYHHNKAHNNAKKAEIQNNIVKDMLNYHIKPCTHDQEAFKKKRTPVPLPENFFTFAWYPAPDDMPRLAEITISMFHEVLGDSFMLQNNVPKFILTVQKCYRPNPYHNFLHAFVVTHTMANIISRYHFNFNGLERKGLMVAALCHDLDHRGYTNNFVQLTKHYLSSLYASSPLENHHFTVAKMIIQKCAMFSYLKPEIYDTLLTSIYKYIIATDLSLYFQCRMELMRIADEKAFTFKDPSHRQLVMSLIMTLCDLSGQTKPMPISRKITEDVYEEFFQQGDMEKKMGYVPIPTMDRDKKDMLFENQVQFLSFAVIPCIETISRIFNMLSPMLEDTKGLLHQWKKLVQAKKQHDLQE
ncbi:cAMP and cAMP-inhibited cGMP 3',5'-cyclic phosphodiesterase 10A-like [Macrosteles quadrilineatus]|uniref:cAMP and cAMP-inhibited cGMP 3',5'-cyclic phosphodiesterase 10A-like n=1 Tax=Macrosteles quadrilineatus TaxID=74068 RepID=UPI0023E2E085|nr:cAMP and cAMP-inhibited cGMP 3',5'-cyclic phosphodiesterase 10A-like [Macrosteles quadrilineatus]